MKASHCSWTSSTILMHERERRTYSHSNTHSNHPAVGKRTGSSGPTRASLSTTTSSEDEIDSTPQTWFHQIFAYKLRYDYLLITLVTVAAYWPSIWAELVFDDRPALIDNKDIRPNTPLYLLLLNDFWGYPLNDELSHKSYRPLTVLTFRWNFWFHGLSPIGYHAINLGLHSFVSILFHKLSTHFVPQISLTTSLLFALHPIHTDAVASVVGRAELLSACFYLSSLLIHLRSKTSKCKPLLTISLSWLGFLCKEQCLTVLVVCSVYDIARNSLGSKLCTGTAARQHLAHSRSRYLHSSVKSGSATATASSSALLLFLGFIFALLFRIWINGRSLAGGGVQLGPTFNRFDNPASVESQATQRLTYAYTSAFHFWTLLIPNQLACDWTHSSVPLVTSLTQPQNVITAAFFAIIALLAFRARRDCQTLLLLTMTLVPFLPASNLFFTTGFVVAERVLYLPSIGFVLLIGKGLQIVMRKRPMLGRFFQAWLLIFFALKTYDRCYDWQTELTLFSSGLKVNPENIKLLNNVGRLEENVGNYSLAEKHFKKAISIETASLRSYLNLGNLYVKMSNYTAAEIVYWQAAKLVEEDYLIKGRISRLHVTALLRLKEVLSRDATKEEETRKLHDLAILLTSYLTKNSSR